MAAPSIVIQTTYAELLDRCAAAAFAADFPEAGTFTAKTVKGRRYWYFQLPAARGRSQRYVGPDTPELRERIERHRAVKDDARERRSLVSTMVRSFGMPAPLFEIGEVVGALARGGVFRLRAILVGTVAYQTYSAMLGERLPIATLQTGDVDIAQFHNVSVAVGDKSPTPLEMLEPLNMNFRAVPHITNQHRTVSYAGRGGIRVDFLTPNEGPDDDSPQHLTALGTDGQPLRFLDFLIHEPEAAAVLHGDGIYVNVPAPERYALHKLIIARRRVKSRAKADKDLQQAAALLEVLSRKRSHELKDAWQEAWERGPTWRELLLQGLSVIGPSGRDSLLKLLGWRRADVPGLALGLSRRPLTYDFDRDVVNFEAGDNGGPLRCGITLEALEDHFGADDLNRDDLLALARKNRDKIERMILEKYASGPVEEPATVLIRTDDVETLDRT